MRCLCEHEKVCEYRRTIDLVFRPVLDKATDQDKVAALLRMVCKFRGPKCE